MWENQKITIINTVAITTVIIIIIIIIVKM
jgi:hypothetical protein